MEWDQHLRVAVAKALCAAFDIDPNSQDAAKRFIPAYLENATNTQAPRNVDVCYYAISLIQGTDYDYIQVSTKSVNGKAIGVLRKTIPVSVLFTFYGPHADSDAEKFWSMFQWDFGYGSPRSVLRQLNIVPMGKPERPVYVYETEGTYQRRRGDVRLNLSYYEETERAIDAIETAPDIITVSQNNN